MSSLWRFVQFVELTNDASQGKDMKIKALRNKKANVDAVSVMFYGSGDLNQNQKDKLKLIRTTCKKVFNLETLPPVYAYRKNLGDKYYAKLMNYEED